ncbi:MAG TPA: hypothetical protein VN372_12780 [Methanospirillum sp.]|nr:hypothetical protein [Methanospirillum sp.]
MRLDEKIRRLSPQSLEKVEAFADFLLFQESSDSAHESARHDQGPQPAEMPPEPEPRSRDKPVVRMKTDSSGIILAEERIDPADSPEAIDFADINTRFAKPDKKEGHLDSNRQRRTLDWL